MRYERVLKSFFYWRNEQGLTRLNIPLYKAEETVKGTYSDAELTALLKKPDIRKTTFAEYRDWVIINFLLNCGSMGVTVAGSLRMISFARKRVHSSLKTACGNLSQDTTRGAWLAAVIYLSDNENGAGGANLPLLLRFIRKQMVRPLPLHAWRVLCA